MEQNKTKVTLLPHTPFLRYDVKFKEGKTLSRRI